MQQPSVPQQMDSTVMETSQTDLQSNEETTSRPLEAPSKPSREDSQQESSSSSLSESQPETSVPAEHGKLSEKPTGPIIEIKEKMIVAQVNDIYLNPSDYLGKTIRYQGIMQYYGFDDVDETYYYVIRYGPGCCGYDANVGFEILWDGEYPATDEWVEVVGVLEEFVVEASTFLRLRLSSIQVMEERGEETVFF